MESKKQIQQIGNESQKTTNYDYDIFVSYRHLSSDSKIHSASLARSIKQAFQLEGFKVFFYCNNTKDAFEIIENTKSRYYIILVTQYSIDTVKSYQYKAFEEKESINEGKEDDGYNFAKELYLIDKGIASNKIDKKNVFLFNIDKCFERRRDIPKTFSDCGYKLLGSQEPQRTEVINFPTDEDFSIDKLINPDPDKEGEIKIKKSPRFSYEIYKELYNSYQPYHRFFWPVILLMFSVFSLVLAFLGANNIQHKEEIRKYKNGLIVFAGGGTVQKYLSLYDTIDVNNYENYPSKYIHLPSKEAWSLLWDDFTEDGESRHYWPIVLSAEKIDDSIRKQKQLKQEVVGYEVGAVSLKVQIINNLKDSIQWQEALYLDDLCELLEDANNIIYTTTEHSGTYSAYKELLSCHFDLDSLIKKQGRKDFTPTQYEQVPEKNHVFLANSLYYYECADNINESVIYSKPQTPVTVPLFVYTIAEQITKGNNNKRQLCPQVEEFLKSIGCNTSNNIYFNSNKITMLPKMEPK